MQGPGTETQQSTHPRDPCRGRTRASPKLPWSLPSPRTVLPREGANEEITEQRQRERALGSARPTRVLSPCYVSGSELGSGNTMQTQTRQGFLEAGGPWPSHPTSLSLSCLIYNKRAPNSPLPVKSDLNLYAVRHGTAHKEWCSVKAPCSLELLPHKASCTWVCPQPVSRWEIPGLSGGPPQDLPQPSPPGLQFSPLCNGVAAPVLATS